jgi:hypothetical protein
MTEHARLSSWLHGHHRLQAFPAVNGYTVADVIPPLVHQQAITIHHSTDSGRQKAMRQQQRFRLSRLATAGLSRP